MKNVICTLAGLVLGLALLILAFPFMSYAEEPSPENGTQYETESPQDDGHWVPLGQYKLTFFCNCRRCCGKWAGGPTASETMPVQGRTVACGSLPLGTHILIEGLGERVVEDRGVHGKHIDVYMDSHQECLRNGVKYAQVFRWVPD